MHRLLRSNQLPLPTEKKIIHLPEGLQMHASTTAQLRRCSKKKKKKNCDGAGGAATQRGDVQPCVRATAPILLIMLQHI